MIYVANADLLLELLAFMATDPPGEPLPDDPRLLRQHISTLQAALRRVTTAYRRVMQARGKMQKRPRGNPGKVDRDARLLDLFDRTPEHLPHLSRCRRVAWEWHEIHDGHLLAPTTVRDAIARARRRRDGGNGKP